MNLARPVTRRSGASKYCKSGGTGLAHCDDGKVVIDIDAQPYCRITIYEHSR